jgi:hypothetical protein
VDTELTKLERKALDIALSGDEIWKADLRRQSTKLRVTARRYTGFGFFTDLACEGCSPASNLPPAESPARVPVAWAAHPDVNGGVAGGISFHVFLKDGVITLLEGASTSSWPQSEDLISFSPQIGD